MVEQRAAQQKTFGRAMWGGAFVLGLLLMLVGLLALSLAVWTSVATIVFLGVMLTIGGVVEVIHAFRVRKTGRPLGYLLGGILSAVVGLLLATRPLAGLGAATLLLAGYFFASGLFRAITSIADRPTQWGWDFAYGLCAIVLGIIVIGGWPASSLWLLGTLVGLEILFRGVALMAGGLSLRHLLRGAERATV